jgi:GR25 family glycosyltransferase involved in LPS biosynthesis
MKSLVVNLERRPDRKDNVINCFQNKIDKYEFYNAVDGKKLIGDNSLYELFYGNDFYWRRGVIGCALSHYYLWKLLLEDKKYDFYCIYEDDIELSDNYNASIKKCQKFISENENVDLLFLGYHMFKENRGKYRNIYDVTDENISFKQCNLNLYIGGTFGYIISKQGAKKMLDYISENRIKHGIDYVMKINSKLNIYECQPLIVKSDWVDGVFSTTDSDIQKDVDSLNFKDEDKYISVKFENEKYRFYPDLDSTGEDLYFIKEKEKLFEMATKDERCMGFNSLGFIKENINFPLSTSRYFNSNDGIYIKETFFTREKITEITYVTAFYDIGRDNWKFFQRGTEEYFKCFEKFLKMNINIIVFIDSKLENNLRKIVVNCLAKVTIISIDENWLLKNTNCWKFIDLEQKNMETESLKALTKLRQQCPETNNAKYNAINHAKVDFISYSIQKLTKSPYLCWVNFGYFKNESIDAGPLDIKKLKTNKINYTLINDIDDNDTDIEYTLKYAPERIAGYFFFGPREKLLDYAQLYHKIHHDFISSGYADDDQHIVLRCYLSRPYLFELHNLKGWHKALSVFRKN